MPTAKHEHASAYESFGQILKAARIAKGLTQLELAARLRRPQSYVSKYETGERRLDFIETSLVCEAVVVRVQDLAERIASQLRSRSRRRAP